MGGKGKDKKMDHGHDHQHADNGDCGGHGDGVKRKGKRKNAYESQPKAKIGHSGTRKK